MPPIITGIAVAVSAIPFYLALAALGACNGGSSLLWFALGLWIIALGIAGLPAIRTAGIIGALGLVSFLVGYSLFAAVGCVL